MNDVEPPATWLPYGSWDLLREAWLQRDARYRNRKATHRGGRSMSEDEENAVRLFRRREIERLPEPARAAARDALLRWYPPSPPL